MVTSVNILNKASLYHYEEKFVLYNTVFFIGSEYGNRFNSSLYGTAHDGIINPPFVQIEEFVRTGGRSSWAGVRGR